jgi:single-strand DNA-binding protein
VFRQLAINASTSIAKGERIVATGKLRVRDWDNGERAGTSVEIEADHLGHDLFWGTSSFTRTVLVADDSVGVELNSQDLTSLDDDSSELVASKK